MINLTELKNEIIVIRQGKYYGCVSDMNNNIIKKGFDTREEARDWINDKIEYNSRWTE